MTASWNVNYKYQIQICISVTVLARIAQKILLSVQAYIVHVS